MVIVKKKKSPYLVEGSSNEAIMTTVPSSISFRNLINAFTSIQDYTWLTKFIRFNYSKLKGSEVYSPPAHISKKSVLVTSPVFPVGEEDATLFCFKSKYWLRAVYPIVLDTVGVLSYYIKECYTLTEYSSLCLWYEPIWLTGNNTKCESLCRT